MVCKRSEEVLVEIVEEEEEEGEGEEEEEAQTLGKRSSRGWWKIPGGTPYMSYIVMCGPNGYCFSVVLVINEVWFLHSCVELGIFFKNYLLSSFTSQST